MYGVVFYEDPKGRRPVEEWLLRNSTGKILISQ